MKRQVTTTTTIRAPKNVGSGIQRQSGYFLYCDGHNAWVKTDAQGKTHVYVNEHGTGYCDCSECEAELLDEVDWNGVTLVAGTDKDSTVTDLNVKMEGGSLKGIVMSSRLYATGDARLTINGGTVQDIYTQYYSNLTSGYGVKGAVYMYIGNLNYSGKQKIRFNGKEAETKLFINNNCDFYMKEARLTEEDVAELKGALVPDSEDNELMIAYGEAVLAPNNTVECDRFKNKATSFSSGAKALMYIRKCDGLVSGSNSIASYVTVKQRAHNQIKQVVKPATCTSAESYRYYCDLCGYKTSSYGGSSVSNHNYVVDEAVDATCCSPGLTEGKHCTKCGRVAVAQTETAATGHNFSAYADKAVCVSALSSSTKTIKVRMCKTCYTMEAQTSSSFSNSAHSWSSLSSLATNTGKWNGSSMTMKQLATFLQKKERAATCTRSGLQFKVCTKCSFVKAVETSALNHKNATSCEAVSATCETAGNKAYSDCGDCGLKIHADGTTFNDLSDAYIAPLGHKYGVSASYVTSSDTKVSIATCSSPAVYHQTCANSGCGHVSEDLVFYGEAAMGHQYRIKSIDYKDPEFPDEGLMTLECTNVTCQRTWPSLYFSFYDEVGTPADGGYWYKTKLLKTQKMPTCVPGWGTYQVTINFKGTVMSKEFDNYIVPMGYVHNCDNDGVCHEEHIVMDYNSDGTIKKTCAGEIQFKNVGVINNVRYSADSTVYTSVGYIAVPYSKVCVDEKGTPYKDPETGGNMYYTDYRVTQVNNQQEMIAAINAQKEPFYAGTYFDWTFYDDDPLYEQYSSGNFSSSAISFDLHGHKINRKLNNYLVVYKVDGVLYKTDTIPFSTTITPLAAPTKEGYTFSGWSEIPATMPAKDVEVSGSFSVNSYILTYKVDGDVYKRDTLAYGATITPLAAPTKTGYTFSGWSEIPATMPAHDVEVTGAFSINSYILTYKVDGDVYKRDTLAYGATIAPLAAPTKTGYTFSGWSEIPATMPAHDVEVTGAFSINSYILTYKVDGDVYKRDTLAYGATIAPLATPTKTGYTFSGWSEIPATMPAHNVEVTGVFSVNSYILTYKVDGDVYKRDTLAYGATITPLAAPTKTGYTFSGWSEIPTTMPAHDVEVNGTFSINSYILTYVVDGEDYKSMKITYGATIIPEAAPTKEGYTFSGWSEIPTTMPAHDVEVNGTFIEVVGLYNITSSFEQGIYYDMQGRKVLHPRKGHVYLLNGRRVLFMTSEK